MFEDSNNSLQIPTKKMNGAPALFTWLSWSIFLIFGLPLCAFGETQNAISLTAPSFTPGSAGAFSASQVSGTAAAGSGTLTYSYSGQVKMEMSSGTGRYSTLGSITRMGLVYDSFILFQSFISNNYLTVASSNTTCPDATVYNWLPIRFRTPDLVRNPNDLTSTGFHAGGTLSYDPNAGTLFTGVDYFDMQGPTLTSSPTYGFNGFSGASCSSGKMKLQATGTDYPMMQYGTVYFGAHGFVYVDYLGNPAVIVGLPRQTLTTNIMSGLSNDVLTGRYIYYTNYTTQDQKNVYVVPDIDGTTFTIKSADDLTDTSQQTTIGTLTCGAASNNLNSPTTGFCSGSLSLVGVSGTGNAVCELYKGTDEHILACAAQYPANNAFPVSLIVSTPKQALLGVTLSGTNQAGVVQTTDAAHTDTVTATLTNRTGRAIGTIGNPSASTSCPGTQDGALCAPFSNSGQFSGSSSSGGSCGTSLAGYGTCTVTITYAPSTLIATLQTYRVAYDSGAGGTLNATARLLGAAGLSSIAITPSTSSFASGTSQQFTATATFTDNSTQDITSGVSWSSGNTGRATITSEGLATWASGGSVTLTSTLGSVSDSVSPTVVPPNPTSVTATVNSSSQITVSYASGGATTAKYQIAYQSGGTAPADCSAGTVITSATVGTATSYPVASLSANTQYSFRVCALDSSDNMSSGATASGTTDEACPANYLTVVANSDVGANTDFCIAKYEMKNVSGVATSQSASTPWLNVTRDQAITACQALGAKYDLISNPEWQAVARTIEGISSNWSNGSSSGSNFLNYGHAMGDPWNAIAASTDNDPCSGTGKTNCATSSHADFAQKRTHTIGDGGILWDFAGNLSEWVKDTNSGTQGASGYLSVKTWDGSQNVLETAAAKLKWGPSGSYTSKSSGPYGGLGYGGLGSTSAGIIRGGGWTNGWSSGVFYSDIRGILYSGTDVGFRCVFHP